MPRANEVTVLKFGSSVLRSEEDLHIAVHEIYRWWREGQQVVAVVSAFGDTTDKLTRLAKDVCDEPDESAVATLLATGEAASSALLGLSLNKSGIPARVFDAVQAGLRTRGSSLDADLIDVDVQLLRTELRNSVVVLPGFVGRGDNGNTTLLGRGGSDLTALFLAHRLNGSCVLLKDVDGLYTTDPNNSTRTASRFSHVTYQTAVRVGGAVVQPKAVRFAEKQRLRFAVTSVGATHSTEVGAATDQLTVSDAPVEPLRVALLGCGTVGGGVYERLAALPELFTVTGVGTRNVESAIAANVPVRLITTNLESLVERPADVVVELIGGTTSAAELVRRALGLGRAVVTANKALLAGQGIDLTTLSEANETEIRFSAAVGGGVPALETAARAAERGRVLGFSGVLNATSNFVLDRMARGETLDEAVSVAQRLGYAEANPQLDLDGTDAAQKLILVARAALGVEVPFDSIERKGVDTLKTATLRRAQERGRVLRFVAECRRSRNKVFASVGPVELPAKHPLASVSGADNRLVVSLQGKLPVVVSGKGAGRWPTAEAVLADLFDIRRELQWNANEQREECVA
jgi:homoserine dehydrogenase